MILIFRLNQDHLCTCLFPLPSAIFESKNTPIIYLEMMNKIWFFQTFLTSIFIRLHMKANLCKTFGNWQLAQTFSFMCHWYFCVKSEPLFTAARAQQANFTWPDKITLTSSHFKRPGSKICLQNPTLWHFSVFIISLWECWTHWTMWKGEKHFSSQPPVRCCQKA